MARSSRRSARSTVMSSDLPSWARSIATSSSAPGTRRASMRALACILLTLLALALPARAADPFHSGKPSEAAAAVAVPAFGGRLVAAAARAQRQLNSAISARFGAVATTGSGAALAGILLLSFAYGVLHAAGPGHGKMVVAAYFV